MVAALAALVGDRVFCGLVGDFDLVGEKDFDFSGCDCCDRRFRFVFAVVVVLVVTLVPLLFAWTVRLRLPVDVVARCFLVVTLVTRDLLLTVLVLNAFADVWRLLAVATRLAATALDFATACFTCRLVVGTSLRLLLSREVDSFDLLAVALRLVPAVVALGTSLLLLLCI